MRHKRAGYKLKRDAGARKALFKGLVTSVIEHERVVTTVPKAKAIKPLVDRMITLLSRAISRMPAALTMDYSFRRISRMSSRAMGRAAA